MSLEGAKYMMTFIDNCFRRYWVYPIKKNSDVFLVSKEYKVQIELEFKKMINCLRINNGEEYTNG